MQTYQSPRYLSVAESAKLLRRALKTEFPGVKFSVRSSSYAGGASISVGWLDGPTQRAVDAVAQVYRGQDFDGMIDMASCRRHYITPQGEVFIAEVVGTHESGGTISGERYIRPHDDAELVTFGSDYVFTERNYSRRMLERAADWAEAKYGQRPEIREHAGGGCYLLSSERGRTGFTVAELAYQELRKQAGPRHSKQSA